MSEPFNLIVFSLIAIIVCIVIVFVFLKLFSGKTIEDKLFGKSHYKQGGWFVETSFKNFDRVIIHFKTRNNKLIPQEVKTFLTEIEANYDSYLDMMIPFLIEDYNIYIDAFKNEPFSGEEVVEIDYKVKKEILNYINLESVTVFESQNKFTLVIKLKWDIEHTRIVEFEDNQLTQFGF